jgi:hypothetical protein
MGQTDTNSRIVQIRLGKREDKRAVNKAAMHERKAKAAPGEFLTLTIRRAARRLSCPASPIK